MELNNIRRKGGLNEVVPEIKRNLVGFWLLGLFNNFAYVIMLSAAHDLLRENANQDEIEPQPEIGSADNETSPILYSNNTGRDCNPVSTGAILLADILPAILIKSLAPFLHLPASLKVSVVTILAGASFLIVSFSHSNLVTYTGVICASLSSGLGEVTFLSYSHQFHPMVISAWSSGTGGAGVLGAGSFALLTHLGLSPRTTLLLMLVVPVGMFLTFFFLIKPSSQGHAEDSVPLVLQEETELGSRMTFQEKLGSMRGLLRYMIPLGLVYFFEYLINQGLFELLYFPKSGLTHSQQYRWYQLDYQMGVLVSRSSLHWIKIEKIGLLALLQFTNFIIFLLQSIYWVSSSLWIVFLLIFLEGLLGGAAYVNTFYRISMEVETRRKEFSLGIASLADSTAIGLAGFVSIYIHNLICALPINNSSFLA
ncbi:battenin isoform X3 [Eurytemora carolleeae]|uniref:battenin isoform X3 n=1 Tax=Eurytemora carolleeae TaxID=1294199 RepID=UPI000C75C318|nr:battenin isoform X3 [Eurytemora carolleeae]|eukprot:XP_023344582.1 battenin-like isoform X3 [Eurytemora affinis]